MAERELDILIAAKDSFSKPLTQAEKAFKNFSDKVEDSSQSMGKNFDSLGGSILGVRDVWLKAAGVVASAAWLVDGAKQALEGEKAFNRLRIQIQSMGIDYSIVSSHVEHAIDMTSRYAVVQDDEVAGVLQKLLLLTGNYSGSVENLNLVYDLSYQKGIDVSQATEVIGKAMTGNIEAIGRIIPEFKNLDDSLGKSATSAEKAALAMDLLRGKVAGATAEMTEHEKQVANAKLVYDRWHESIGDFLLGFPSFVEDMVSFGAFFRAFESASFSIDALAAKLNGNMVTGAGAAGNAIKSIEHPLNQTYKGMQNGVETADQYAAALSRIKNTIDAFTASASTIGGSAFTSMFAPTSLSAGPIENPIMAALADVPTESGSSVETEAARLRAQEEMYSMKSPYEGFTRTDEISSAYNEYDSKLKDLEQYNARKLSLMEAAGASELEIEAAHAELSNQYAASRRDFQINSASQTFGAMSNFMQNMYTLAGSKNKDMFQMMKAFAITEAVINTAQAVTAAIKNPPGPPWSFAYAAAAAASGMAQIQTIASSEPGSKQTISATGHASPGYAGGSPTAYPVPTRAEEAKAPISITLVVNTLDGKDVNWDRVIEDNLAPALEKYSKDGNRPLDIKVTKQ